MAAKHGNRRRDRVNPVPDQAFIAVVGTGVATGIPDQCKLQIALNSMKESAAEALTTCAEIASTAIAAIGDVAVEHHDVQTTGLSLQDWFDKDQRSVTARVATYQLEVTIRPVDGVSSVLAALAASTGDALQVRGIRLGVRDPEPMRIEARRLAVEDARRKAVELSQSAGIGLGSILAMEDDGARSQVSYRLASRAMFASGAPNIPIEPGEVSAVSSITVTYAIES
jgi:uncharacterized protein